MYIFLLWILPIIVFALLLIWFFTSTNACKDVPLLLPITLFGISWIPGVGIGLDTIFLAFICINVDDLDLKNNWFNRTFLAYRE